MKNIIRLRDDTLIDPDIKVGVMIAIMFLEDCFSVVRVSWGPESEWEEPMDGAVEQHWLFDEEETRKLMQVTEAENGTELINVMYNRFKDYAHEADYYITEWCKSKGIEYLFYYHREMTSQMELIMSKLRKDDR